MREALVRNAQVTATGEVKMKLLAPVKRYKGKTEFAQVGWFLHKPFMPADYAVYVRRPMDLGSIAARLEKGAQGGAGGYSTYGEVIGDVRLVFANAVKYNDARGVVEFKAHDDKQAFRFSLTNTTPLTLDGLDDRVFERFYRHLDVGNQSISAGSGSGLGLSLCKEIVKAHGGEIGIRTHVDNRVTIAVTLPLGPAK